MPWALVRMVSELPFTVAWAVFTTDGTLVGAVVGAVVEVVPLLLVLVELEFPHPTMSKGHKQYTCELKEMFAKQHR